MAASSSSTSLLCNSFSFLSPSKPHLPKTLPPSQFLPPQTHKPKHGFFPLVAASNSTTSMAVSSSSSSLSTTTTTSSDDVLQVVHPSLAYANTMFFKSAYNVQVIVEENEHEEKLVGRFRREVMRAGIIQESKRRRFFENKQDEKKRRTREAAKRNRKRRPWRPLPGKQEADAAAMKKKKDDDEDNWELPAGDLPN